MKKYIVHMAVDGRIDLEVEAENPADAYIKAFGAFGDADLSKMEVIDAKPVHCEDETGEIVKEY
jgi:hypothetical protein